MPTALACASPEPLSFLGGRISQGPCVPAYGQLVASWGGPDCEWV